MLLVHKLWTTTRCTGFFVSNLLTCCRIRWTESLSFPKCECSKKHWNDQGKRSSVFDRLKLEVFKLQCALNERRLSRLSRWPLSFSLGGLTGPLRNRSNRLEGIEQREHNQNILKIKVSDQKLRCKCLKWRLSNKLVVLPASYLKFGVKPCKSCNTQQGRTKKDALACRAWRGHDKEEHRTNLSIEGSGTNEELDDKCWLIATI